MVNRIWSTPKTAVFPVFWWCADTLECGGSPPLLRIQPHLPIDHSLAGSSKAEAVLQRTELFCGSGALLGYFGSRGRARKSGSKLPHSKCSLAKWVLSARRHF